MKQIILKSIDISNFKGVHDLQVSFSPGQTNIFGDNATGKTTVFDAFLWLLFGKDSSNATKFDIKPLSTGGTVAQKGVEPTVTATLQIDGRPVQLRKILKEKWNKPRGKVEAEFGGNEIKYAIDGVPKKEKEYDAFISEIIPEEMFRMLTDVTYFNTQLRWDARRRILLDVCGDITDADVIYQNDKLKALAGELMLHNMEDLKKMMVAKRQDINKRRTELPIRIDEANKSIVPGIDVVAEQKAVDELNDRLALLDADRAALLAIDTLEAQRKELYTKIRELETKNTEYKIKQREAFAKQSGQSDRLRRNIQSMISQLNREKAEAQDKIRKNEEMLQTLRSEYSRIFASQWEGDNVCPTCGQEIPVDQIEARKTAFQLERSRKLEDNQKYGKEIKAHLEDLQNELEGVQEELAEAAIKLDGLPPEAEFSPEDLPGYANDLADFNRDLLLLNKKDRESAAQEQLQKIEVQKSEINPQLSEHKKRIMQAENNEKFYARIAEMETEEKKLAEELGSVEQKIFLTEEFTREKVRMLEEKINRTFKYARFKLFDVQNNGGLSERCEVTFEGVPYSGLNSAGKINIGIDIINALAVYYDTSAPVWIDNAESVTSLLPSIGQMIRLVVSEQDKQLRIEKEAS